MLIFRWVSDSQFSRTFFFSSVRFEITHCPQNSVHNLSITCIMHIQSYGRTVLPPDRASVRLQLHTSVSATSERPRSREREKRARKGETELYSHAYKRHWVREVFLEEPNDLMTRANLLKLFEGHEEGACERLVLNMTNQSKPLIHHTSAKTDDDEYSIYMLLDYGRFAHAAGNKAITLPSWAGRSSWKCFWAKCVNNWASS